ncbi:MAG: DNA internalization-related competence protein ComEC/Rec2 [Bradymonadia bacterium]
MQHPWLHIAIAFVVGTVPVAMEPGFWPWALASGVLLALGSSWVMVHKVVVGLWLLGFAAGALASMGPGRWSCEMPPPPESPLVGEIVALHTRGPSYVIDVAPDQVRPWRLRIILDARNPEMAPGARVRFSGAIRSPTPVDNPWQFDHGAHLARDQVAWLGRGVVQVVTPGTPGLALRAREVARSRLKSIGAPQGAAVLMGLLLGDRHAVDDRARQGFQRSGLAHLMAVSGLHVGGLALSVMALVTWLARRLGAALPFRWAVAPAILAVWIMVALAQHPLSATRAGIMAAVALVGRAMGRPADPLNLVGAAAIWVLVDDPLAWQGPAFQMSFGAVVALILAPRHWSGPMGALAVATLAACSTAPIQAWHFGSATPIAPLANLLLVPIAAFVVVPLGAFGLVVFPLTEQPLLWAAHCSGWLSEAALILARWGDGGVMVGAQAALPLTAPLIVALGIRLQRARLAMVVALVVGVLWLGNRSSTLMVECLAVGQGDALLISTPEGAALIDGGPDTAGRVLLSHLHRQGVTRLRWVALSHGHPDHFNGLMPLLEDRAITIEAFYYNGRWPRGPDGQRMAKALARRGVRPRRPPVDAQSIGALQVRFLAVGGPAYWSENDASLVVRLDGPGGSMLLTGDVEAEAEAGLVARGIKPVDVLKAGHHGSKTSSTAGFIDALSPRAVIFTTGRDNRYGFPHGPVRRRYRQRNIEQWRTDRHGLVRVILSDPMRIESHHHR